MESENLYKIKEDFLKIWSIDKLKSMTLDEYTNLNKTSFCYWLEAITTDVGSVWGGSAYKFGIFKRRDLESDNYNDKRKSDGEYAWYGKYGSTKSEVFENIRGIILNIATTSQLNELEKIDKIDLGDAIKWKIAFLYGDFNIVNIFNQKALNHCAKQLGYDGKSRKYAALNQYILSKKGDKEFFEFTKELWDDFDKKNSVAVEFEKWLKENSDIDSRKVSSYLKAIDILRNHFNISIYVETDVDILQELYEDLKSHQKETNGKYYYEKANSYGVGGFYSAAIKNYIEFVNTKSSITKTDEDESRLIALLKEIGHHDAEVFYSLMETVLTKLSIKEGDTRICYSLPKTKLIGLTIGQKYCVIVKRKNKQNTYSYFDTTKNEDNWLKEVGSVEELSNHLETILTSATNELQKTAKTGYTNYSSLFLEKSLFNIEYKKSIFKKAFNERTTTTPRNMNPKLNQILFGPPGTGKTFNTVNHAVSIINPLFDLSQGRDAIKREFDKFVENGQILFTTFHQNMSYEDFIEGIKPVTKEGKVTYEIKDGLFKQICNKALLANINDKKQTLVSQYNDFDSVYEKYVENVEERLSGIDEDEKLKLPLKSKGYYTEIKSVNTEHEYFLTRGGKANSNAKVRKDRLRLLFNKFESIEDIKEVSTDIRSVGSGLGWSSNYYGVFKDLKEFEKQIDKSDTDNQIDYNDYEKIKSFLASVDAPEEFSSIADRFVIIIDEINRGNISQIFGELITLLEDNKRLGKKEALKLILPYSKSRFGVPPNVFVIGTMNTADRSIEALDTALRRRFSFKEMQPQHDLIKEVGRLKSTNGVIENISVIEVLKTINDRIEKLIDKDHKIGHSYFLNINSLKELKQVFSDKVIPLLEEYFFGDLGKIGLVLGGSFISKSAKEHVKFARFEDYDSSIANDLEERSVYDITDQENWDFKSIYAV